MIFSLLYFRTRTTTVCSREDEKSENKKFKKFIRTNNLFPEKEEVKKFLGFFKHILLFYKINGKMFLHVYFLISKNMKNLLSKTGNEWGRFLHKNACSPCSSGEKMTSVEVAQESHEEMKSCEKETAKELHRTSIEVSLSSHKNTVEQPEEKTEKAREARRRVREEFKDIARNINGQEWHNLGTGEITRVESFVPEKKITLRRPKITVYRSGGMDGNTKEVYILGVNKIIRKEYHAEAKGKHKWKTENEKGGFTYNTKKNTHEIAETKDRMPGNPNTLLKTKDKHKVSWDKSEKEKTKFKDTPQTQAVLDSLKALSGVRYEDCPMNCFEI